MNEEEISDLVGDFLAKQSPRFSDLWKADIVSHLRNLEPEAEIAPGRRGDEHDKEHRRVLVRTKCEVIHEQKLAKLRGQCESILEDKSQLDYQLVNQLVYDAYNKWLKTFRPEKGEKSKNPELHWLMLLVAQATSNHFRRKGAKIEYVDFGENFKATVDPTAQQRLEDIILGRQGYELDEEYQTINFRVINSRDGGPLTSDKRKRIASVARQEIFRHYSLTRRAHPPVTIDNLPPLIGSYQDSLTSFIISYRGHKLDLNLSFLDSGSVTGYFKLRHHVLCNADSRRWMELAVSKLGELVEKTREGLLQALLDSKTEEFDGDSPASVAVAVCASGKVYTCFKEGVDIDLIRDESPMLKGGTLYITQEPCGGSSNAGEGRDGEAKIPCEVRYVEAGFSHYYVGSLDYGNTARGNGLEILRTGVYAFKLEQGDHASVDAAAGSALLEKYFQKKGFLLIEETEECRKYKIGEPANVSFFDADLMFEVYKLNAGSQHRHGRGNGSEPPSDVHMRLGQRESF